ncbi:dTDP-4-dehydrorhamnose 3,5-epimerase [Candidatus Venteria ishoeyi]|uniref:dTDP-4-dehydrorhamnose 3,5-epimerase n=1 Tax=Candidatus Venteria ishoeyi TaxID=1899563 RepID=UPI0025A640DD|nr:dTDP-4-dehydrorhamnose 3,5-epimerase [Candidatus Venteria ishoeyi]MDM8546566.1 dTDP-4-dehydrorhamnose 3,5-epimerase [Candidatus Venteria ishoeyi]
MKIIATPLDDVFVVESERFSDQRGSFARFFCTQELASVLGLRHIKQINHSITLQQGTIRGMHFQYPPHAEMKMVRCIKGEVFDVAVDLRTDSKNFLHWHGEILNPENNKMMLIPEGFAHGFQTLSTDTELLYLHTAAYAPQYEGGIAFDDPALNISWPLALTDCSERDRQHKRIDNQFTGIAL